MKQTKAQGLPINLVVTLIIGIVIFGLGFGLFSKISSSGQDQIDDLSNKVKTGITSLECDGEDWICAPSYKLKNGDSQTFNIYVSNKGDESAKFKVEFPNLVSITDDGKQGISKDGCGSVFLLYPSIEFNVLSGESAQIPFTIKATKVTSTPCSFVTTAKLINLQDARFEQKTSIIIRVE